MQIKSPLTKSSKVALEQTIKCQFIIDTYLNILNIDVKKYFDSLDCVKIYRCEETGYRFYYPFNLAGDSKFYELIQRFPWYYMDLKWEFDMASKIIQPGDLMLEVGCGTGKFIDKMQDRGVLCTGLEFNQEAIEVGERKGLNIFGQSIQEYAKVNPERYDVVCFFQVLEHITDVKEFIQSSINALKQGGNLIVCVPNNDSFIKHDEYLVTNMPPHHMGLWNKKSLSSLQSLFNVKLKKIYLEPLNLESCENYRNVQMRRMLASNARFKLIEKIAHKVVSRPLLESTKLIKNLIHGTSILAVYEKL